VLAYGLSALQPWAWMLGVGLSIASIVLALLDLMQGTTNLVGAIISIAISAAIIYYLFTSTAKAAFGRT
jgi:tetrahydromethanopterin S-methyltransferase subunit C